MIILNEKFIKLHTGLNISIINECVSAFNELGKNDAVIALSQKGGKGRGDNSFFSPLGGLYIVMRLQGLYINAHTLTPAIGLAVHDTVATMLKLPTRLKWVNDVIYNDKKVAGILCRCPRRGEYIVGIGINYSTPQQAFDQAGLGDIACSLNAPETRASAFVTGLINRIRRATLAEFDYGRYAKLCVNVGKKISFIHNGTKVAGYAEGIDRNGSLIVRIGNVTVAVDAGEVSIVRNGN